MIKVYVCIHLVVMLFFLEAVKSSADASSDLVIIVLCSELVLGLVQSTQVTVRFERQ